MDFPLFFVLFLIICGFWAKNFIVAKSRLNDERADVKAQLAHLQQWNDIEIRAKKAVSLAKEITDRIAKEKLAHKTDVTCSWCKSRQLPRFNCTQCGAPLEKI